jgi:formylmethanofuran dehydrogenase subunit B
MTTMSTAWTCPFCALHCDDLAVEVGSGGTLELQRSDCPRARSALARHAGGEAACEPSIDGQPVTLERALDAATGLLARSGTPLFGGLGTDVAGARSLYALASRCHAILDHAGGRALAASTRALQDRGMVLTTLAEVRTRADLIVCLGTQPGRRLPEFFRRVLADSELVKHRKLVFVGCAADPTAQAAAEVETIAADADLFLLTQQLAAIATEANERVAAAAPEAARLIDLLRAARYAVIVYEPAALPQPHAELIIEAIHRLLRTLNRKSRAAALPLGGHDGALAVNHTVSWLSGLPLRTALHPAGLRHDPLRYATDRLLDERAIDLLLWVATIGDASVPAAPGLPQIVLASAAVIDELSQQTTDAARVLIPVATPGIDCDGHLVRCDSVVMLPLKAVRASPLPTVAMVADALLQRLPAIEVRA